MSDPVSALPGAGFEGLARIEEIGPRGMIMLKGDLSSSKLRKVTTRLTGVEFPDQRGANCAGETGLLWMAPDELLLLVPRDEAVQARDKVAAALAGEHHLAEDVSDARALFAISGAAAREVLAKLTPADLHSDSFAPGELRRTRVAQVPAAFWMRDAETFELLCFRSVAAYMFDLLKTAADPKAPVGYF